MNEPGQWQINLGDLFEVDLFAQALQGLSRRERFPYRPQVLAITGTNGKTSTAWWLAQALSNLQGPLAMPCGLIGTLGTGRPPNVEFNGRVDLQGMFITEVEPPKEPEE